MPHNGDVFMAIVKKCGHNKRGVPIYKPAGQLDDEFPEVAAKFRNTDTLTASRLGFWAQPARIYVPRYYDPEVREMLAQLDKSGRFALSTVQELISQGALSIRRGVEVGSSNYGSGDVPFIRTSDISNWEISHDPTFSVTEEIYEQTKDRIDLRPLDILFVNDGRYRIGDVAILSKDDTKIVVQSHIRIIRVLKPNVISPYLLLNVLNNKVVRRQIETKTFVQSTIATLGSRLREVVLPIPKDEAFRESINREVSEILGLRSKLRERMRPFFDQ
jgi:type I restriction enzyme M protein